MSPQNQGPLKIQGAVQLVSEIHVVPLPSLFDVLKLTNLTFNRFMCPLGAAFRSTCREVAVNEPGYQALIRASGNEKLEALAFQTSPTLYQKVILLQ